MIANGRKYAPRTCQSFQKWHAYVEVRRRHRYSARTAYGERAGWKYSHSISLGEFPSRQEALATAKAHIAGLIA